MFWQIIGTALAVVFGITTIVLAIKLTKRKKPAWAYATTKLIGLGTDAPPELQLVFDGKSVPEVYRTLIIFFNGGNETIRKADVTDSIKIRFQGAELLRNAYPIILSNMQTRLEVVSRSNNMFELDFYYLDHNDGAVIEALHTKHDRITCEGSIIGAGTPRYVGEFAPNPPEGLRSGVIMFSVILTLIALMLWSRLLTGGSIISIALVFCLMIIVMAIISHHSFRFMKFPNWSRLQKAKRSKQT